MHIASIGPTKDLLSGYVSAKRARERTLYVADAGVGIGMPVPLSQNLSGFCSRRITDEHRPVYKVDGDSIVIIQARYHYRGKPHMLQRAGAEIASQTLQRPRGARPARNCR